MALIKDEDSKFFKFNLIGLKPPPEMDMVCFSFRRLLWVLEVVKKIDRNYKMTWDQDWLWIKGGTSKIKFSVNLPYGGQ